MPYITPYLTYYIKPHLIPSPCTLTLHLIPYTLYIRHQPLYLKPYTTYLIPDNLFTFFLIFFKKIVYLFTILPCTSYLLHFTYWLKPFPPQMNERSCALQSMIGWSVWKRSWLEPGKTSNETWPDNGCGVVVWGSSTPACYVWQSILAVDTLAKFRDVTGVWTPQSADMLSASTCATMALSSVPFSVYNWGRVAWCTFQRWSHAKWPASLDDARWRSTVVVHGCGVPYKGHCRQVRLWILLSSLEELREKISVKVFKILPQDRVQPRLVVPMKCVFFVLFVVVAASLGKPVPFFFHVPQIVREMFTVIVIGWWDILRMRCDFSLIVSRWVTPAAWRSLPRTREIPGVPWQGTRPRHNFRMLSSQAIGKM